eukprot:5137971-Pyramimonas_sp.AAC.1
MPTLPVRPLVEPRCGVTNRVRGGAFGGDPDGDHETNEGCAEIGQALPRRPSVEPPHVATNRVS